MALGATIIPPTVALTWRRSVLVGFRSLYFSFFLSFLLFFSSGEYRNPIDILDLEPVTRSFVQNRSVKRIAKQGIATVSMRTGFSWS